MRTEILFLIIIINFALYSCSQGAYIQNDKWRIHFNAGKQAKHSGEPKTAKKRFLKSLEYARKYENPPGLRTALSVNALGILYLDDNLINKAEPLLYESMNIFETIKDTKNIHFVSVLLTVGDLELKKYKGTNAETIFKRAFNILSQINNEPPSIATRVLKGIIASLCMQKKIDEANDLGKDIGQQCEN